jgi:hypothetical protein
LSSQLSINFWARKNPRALALGFNLGLVAVELLDTLRVVLSKILLAFGGEVGF